MNEMSDQTLGKKIQEMIKKKHISNKQEYDNIYSSSLPTQPIKLEDNSRLLYQVGNIKNKMFFLESQQSKLEGETKNDYFNSSYYDPKMDIQQYDLQAIDIEEQSLDFKNDNYENDNHQYLSQYQLSEYDFLDHYNETEYNEGYDINPINVNESIIQEFNLSAQIQKQGELFYFKKKIPKTVGLFKGYSEILGRKVIAEMFKMNSQDFAQLVFITSYINLTYLGVFFSGHIYHLTHFSVKSVYLYSEIYQDYDEHNTIYSIQQRYKGSLIEFIKYRKYIYKPLTTSELESIFLRLLYIGGTLELLNLYHTNFSISKILINYDKQGKFILESIVLTQLQKIIYLKPNEPYIDLNHPDQFQINFNGYNSPEVLSFQTKLNAFKQNSYAVGLFMINLITLEVFSTSRFIISFKKGVQMLENDDITDKLRNGIYMLLKQDQDDRLTCSQIVKNVFSTEIIPLEAQYIQKTINFDNNMIGSQQDINNTNLMEIENQDYEITLINQHEYQYRYTQLDDTQ